MVRNFLVAIILFFVLVPSVHASEEFINIVNPVRVSKYNPDTSASIKAEYKIISNYNLPATWLLTLDVLNDNNAINALKSFNKNPY